ncbi:serine hydrolase domain-containing protein [Shewanella atlantica]|uniref:Class A beta-lactamase-related serine hydrolase n=1 Tax=Shewanella atlantica TaxID=271099 RepID=A0A3S0RRC0_9GAMM|nr:serine hydrolase domain-containing protein [Shewanella atlantica]RTR34484.1 class A beta-lactamase-related serine hydrolase [Shewanella atlantica]
MKTITSLLLLALPLALSHQAQAVEFKPVDSAFVQQSSALGVTQDNWDHGAHAAATFPNAYRFTPHMDIPLPANGKFREWSHRSQALLQLTGYDLDGEHSLEVLLRDRLKNHSMVVLNKGVLVHQHFWNGYGAEQTHLQMSVTKSFTSLLASIAVAQGKLDMDRGIIHYLPELKGTGFEDATVQEVADMRSGIGVTFSEGKLWDDRMTEAQDWNGDSKYPDMRGVIDYAMTLDNHRPIGKVYDYLDVNTELLGKVVEKVQGQALAQLLESQIWSKIGAEQPAKWMSNRKGEVVASGGLNMTTRDLAKVGEIIANKGVNQQGERVIPAEFIDSLFQGDDKVRFAWQQGKESALATGWYKDQFRVLDIKGHKFIAMVGIHGQILVIEPESQTVVAMNSGFGDMEPPRMAILIFHQIIPAILDKLAQDKV